MTASDLRLIKWWPRPTRSSSVFRNGSEACPAPRSTCRPMASACFSLPRIHGEHPSAGTTVLGGYYFSDPYCETTYRRHRLANLRYDVKLNLIDPKRELLRLYPGEAPPASVEAAVAALYAH